MAEERRTVAEVSGWLPGFKARLGDPFPHQADLEEKRAEMAELEASLAATPGDALRPKQPKPPPDRQATIETLNLPFPITPPNRRTTNAALNHRSRPHDASVPARSIHRDAMEHSRGQGKIRQRTDEVRRSGISAARASAKPFTNGSAIRSGISQTTIMEGYYSVFFERDADKVVFLDQTLVGPATAIRLTHSAMSSAPSNGD